MQTVDIAEAVSSLPHLVDAIEQRQVRGIIITRVGRPVAKLVPVDSVARRIGVAAGVFEIPDTLDSQDDEIARLFDDPRHP